MKKRPFSISNFAMLLIAPSAIILPLVGIYFGMPRGEIFFLAGQGRARFVPIGSFLGILSLLSNFLFALVGIVLLISLARKNRK